MDVLGPEIFKGFKQDDYVPYKSYEEQVFNDALTSLAVETAIEFGIRALEDDVKGGFDVKIWNFIALVASSGREIEMGLLSGPILAFFDGDEILANIVVRKK